MNTPTHTIFSSGEIRFGAYTLTFSTGDQEQRWNWIELYDAKIDDTFSKEYATMDDVLNTIPLLMTSAIMREEFCK
jgi:hypothetical protein